MDGLDRQCWVRRCGKCSSPKRTVVVKHSVPGHGSVREEEVEYCPNCDEKPNEQGNPISCC